jgi:tRNA pseudouridine55 synthase
MGRRASPDGVLLLDKPPGITSTRALARAKRLLGSLKGGHTGTLDPFATGLLPLVFGEATKFSRFLIDARKSYEAVLRLGEETVTGDTESPVVRRAEVSLAPGQLDEVLAAFRGGQAQVPPMHSAVRIDGRRLYEYARAGREVERPARSVVIDEVEAAGRAGDDLTLRVTCSKGTYIRTLAQDIGRALGCGAHLVALRRTAVGPFSIAQAASFEELEAGAARDRLLPTEVLVAGLARFDATPEETDDFVHGRPIHSPGGEGGRELAVFAPGGRFLGVGLRDAPGSIAPRRLMAEPPDLS